MTNIFSMLLALPLAVATHFFFPIPEAPLRLTHFYPSSTPQDVTAKLSAPTAVAVARSGNIYIYDDGNSRIVKVNPGGKFIAEFGGPGSGPGAVQRAGLSASIAVDQHENVYVGDSVSPKVRVFDSKGSFIRSFRVPFPVMSLTVNSKQEIFVAVSANSPTQLILVFSETGKFLRQFGERLVANRGKLARSVNQTIIACDSQDNVFVAFRSWPLIRKYSPDGTLLAEKHFEVPPELLNETHRQNFSLDFITRNPDSSFVLPLLTHSLSITRSGRGYLLLNAHSVVIFGANCEVSKQFRFKAPRDHNNLFIRLTGNLNSRHLYLLDTRSAEIYRMLNL